MNTTYMNLHKSKQVNYGKETYFQQIEIKLSTKPLAEYQSTKL